MDKSQAINYPKYGSFHIFTTNHILKFRADSFLKKEPTTLEWLQGLEKNSVLIDVGANIGIYTIPSALFHVKKVVALEPEIQNYSMLLKNIDLNKIPCEKVEALPLAVSTEYANKFTRIYLTSEKVGEGCHQVGKNQNHLLEEINSKDRKFRSIYCVSLASIVRQVNESHKGPIHIKIDVDGIEEDVCQSLFDEKLINRVSSLQIELNSDLPSHKNLISKLASAGYYYSHKQVEKSVRKSGIFKNFAEIVFTRSMAQDCIKKLPNEFVKTLGEAYTLIEAPRQRLAEAQGFLTLNHATPIALSRQPSSYALKNAFNTKLCAVLFHKVSNSVIAEGKSIFNFSNKEGFKSKSQLRHTIGMSNIEEISPQYAVELAEQATSREFISKISKIVKHAAQFSYPENYLISNYANPENQQLKDTHLICRIRHFIDIQGYSLDIHNDSHDTFCALIAPLIPFTTTTCIANGGFFDRKFKRVPDKHKTVASDFNHNKLIDAQTSPSTYIQYVKKNGKSFEHQTPHTLQQSNLSPGEIFVLPNMKSYIFGDISVSNELKIINHISNNIGHGVLPIVQEPYRPVLLIDYMFANPKDVVNSSDTQLLFDIGESIEVLK